MAAMDEHRDQQPFQGETVEHPALPAATALPWEKVSETPAYRGRRKLDSVVFRLPDGSEETFEIKREGTPVCVLAITVENEVVLARQFRPGPQRVLAELPGGGMDKGELPIEAAARELLEETGCAGDIYYIGTSYSDAYSTLRRYNFVAVNCRKVQEPQNDPKEPIEVVTMSLEQFRAHLLSGQLTDATTGYMGLDYLKLL